MDNEDALIEELTTKLLNSNSKQGQLFIIIGELAELITAITDYFNIRTFKPKNKSNMDVLDEIADIELQLVLLKKILFDTDVNIYSKLRLIKKEKYNKLLEKFNSL